MNDLRRALAYAATTLGISYDTAMILPFRVVMGLWEERERLATEAAGVAARAESRRETRDGTEDDDR